MQWVLVPIEVKTVQVPLTQQGVMMYLSHLFGGKCERKRMTDGSLLVLSNDNTLKCHSGSFKEAQLQVLSMYNIFVKKTKQLGGVNVHI